MGQAVCKSCGNLVRETARFCSRCGGPLGLMPPSAIAQQDEFPASGPQPYYEPTPPQPPYQQQTYQSPYQQQPYVQDPYHQPYQYGQQQFQQNRPAEVAMPAGAWGVEPKDRTTAIVLAVFLGFCTWLYTYKRDAWKFWLSLALTLTVFNPLWTWLLLFLPNLALHIWAITDVAVRQPAFYDRYPAG